jgi:hypothetical protein
MYIKYTGTLDSACTITIGPNTMKRVHIIENATSGSQNIIISQGSGANVTIGAGNTKVVYLDGAGSGAAVVDAFASLSVVDLTVDDDLSLLSDSAVLKFGADADTTLTHTDGTGLTLNSTNKLCFNDASQFVQGSSATVLSIGATDEIDLTASTIDINGAVEISGATTQTGISTSAAKDVFNAGMSVKNGATSAGFIEFFEDSDNGTNKVTLIGPSSTSDITLTLPSSAGTLALTTDGASKGFAIASAIVFG